MSKAIFGTALMALPLYADAQVSGTVFRDFNGNGTKDTYEPGAAGITVKAYDSAGTQLGATATSSSTGAWSITTGTTATVRVEFKLPTTNSNPVGPLAGVDFSAPGGSTYGSSVQFVAGNATGVNYALMAPNDYWDAAEDHRYVMSCFVNGLASGTGGSDAAVVSTPASSAGLNNAYTNDLGVQGTGPNPSMDAIISQVGSVWGAAYYKTQKHFYFSTFLKRHCGMADGPGYIYNYDYSGGTAAYTGKFNLQGATPNNGGPAIDLGTVTRTGSSDYTLPSNKTTPNVDLDAFGKVGTISFGDIDMQPGTGYLWAVNLYQKALIRVNVSGNPTSLPSDVEQYILDSLPGYPSSSTGVLRPWALAFNAGKGYLGVIADASISGADADLRAYVLQFDPNNIAAGFTTMLNFDPNIKRGSLSNDIKFHRWLNTYAEPPVTVNGQKRWFTQPVLSDLEFDENGNMLLSFFDRFGHQMGYFNYSPLPGSTTIIRAFGYGEILKACTTGTGWEIEGTGSCSTGAEYFTDTAGDGEVEGSEGGSALLKGKNQLMEISIDPHPNGTTGQAYWSTQGVNTYSLSTGLITNWYSVYRDASAALYGKANGLGDMEFIVDAAPIEIGNRVWNDTDRDGVQDAGEAGIGNVSLELYPDFNNDGSPDAITAVSACETSSFSSGVNNACAGSVAWTNPGNATKRDGIYSTGALSSTNTSTNCLQVTGAGFGIPSNATINGVTVSIVRRSSAATSARDQTVQLLIGGTASGSNLATTTSWPTTAGAATYGSTTNLWGLTLTPAQVNASNFGVNIRAQRTANSPTVSVDYVEISVCYTTAAGTYAIATTTTATSGAVGTWYFNASNVLDGDPTTAGSQPGLAANKNYIVRVGSSDWTGGIGTADLLGMVLTTANNGAGADQPDEVDSDAALVSSIPQISVTTGGIGQTNHSLDMGFWNCPTITSPSAAQTICVGAAGTNITVNTNQNAANSIRFVRFSSDQSAINGSETSLELSNIYAGTAIATVTPAGGASPYTATYVFNASDFPSAGTYYVYAILNPDLGATCRPVQEIRVFVNNATASVTTSDQMTCPNAQLTLASSATGQGTLTYQWQSSTTGCGGTFTNIGGATQATYQLPIGFSVTTNYRVVVTSTLNGVACSATSNCITITATNVTGTLAQTAATCTGDLPNNNGAISLTAVSNANRYGISFGTAYTGPAYSAANNIGALPMVVQSSVPNSGGSYVIRFFNGSNNCYNDITVNVGAVDCTSGNCTSGNLGGVAWADLDADGTKDASETGLFSNVVVRVYDCNGNLVAADVTNSTGNWWVNDNGFTYPVRVEFANIPSYAYATMDGTNSKTSVQFVNAASCAVDLGVQVPADYCDTANPLIGLSCFEPGNAIYGGTGNLNKGIIAFPYNTSGPTPCCMTEVAKIYQVGTVWGMGYQARHKRMFTSATLMRHMGLGPQGLGGVYVMDYTSGLDTLVTSFSLQGVSPANGGAAIDLGSVNRTGTDYQLPNNNTTSSWDIDAFDKIGKVGFGDADVSQDGNTLWLVNLNQRALVSVDITSAASYPGTVKQYMLSDATGLPTCTNGVLRPWGLAFENGKGYLGCMCTGESGGTDANLRAYVLSFDPANPTAFATEATFPLNYVRERAVDFPTLGVPLIYEATWRRWASNWAETGYTTSPISEVVYAQPILSDIDFDTDGNMLLGIADRFGFQLGYTNYIPVSGITVETGADAAGDILKLCKSGSTWVMEGSGGCTESDDATKSALGNDGPGGTGEFFYDDGFNDTGRTPTYNHNETALGSLGTLKGINEVTATHYDPADGNGFAFDLGLLWHNTTSGARVDSFRIVSAGPASTKGNGLGDFEFVCAAAPKQIGNYVWIDTDKDGVQDPCESGVNGVRVSLYKLVSGTATLVASTTTATVNGLQGAYYFKDYQQYGSGFDTLSDNTLYYVVLGESGGTSTWSTTNQSITIGGVPYTITAQNTGEGVTPDLNDSDAFVFMTAGKPYTNYPVDTVTIGYAGYINHSLDFGLRPCPTITNPSAAQTICAGGPGANITVNTTTNTSNSIRFVRFTTDQMAGTIPTPAEAAAIYAGTAISTVTPTGGASPYTATYVFNAADFPSSGSVYYVYAILNPDEGASCRPTQEIRVNINNVTASTVGGDQTICPSGDPAAFTVTTAATGAGTLTYQWQKSTTSCSADFVNISGATSATYNPPAGLTLTTYYRVVVTSTLNGVGCSATSNCITVTTLPFCATYCANNVISNASFENPSLPGSGTFSFAGGTAVNLGTAAPTGFSKATTTGDNYWVQSSKARSGNKYIYMYSSGTTPASTDACTQFTKASLTGNTTYNICIFAADAKADGFGSGLSLEVQENSGPFHWLNFLVPNNPAWSDVAATDVPWTQYCYTFTTAPTTTSLTMWLSASAEQGGTTSYVVIDDVCVEPTTIAQQPTIGGSSSTAATCTGGAVNNNASITLTGITNGNRADKVTGATYTGGPAYGAASNVTVSGGNAVFTNLMHNTQYTFRVWNAKCDCYADLTVTTPTTCCVAASVVGSDQAVCTGGNPAAFTVTSAATGNGTLTYQWQSSTTNCSTGFANIAGATSDTYDPPTGFTQTTHYRVVVTNTVNGSTCTATSNCVTVTLNNLTASVIGSDQNICSGGNPAIFTVTTPASGAGALTYQWQRSTTSCAAGFSNIVGATSDTYDPPTGLTQTTYYRVVVTSTLSGVPCTATSNCVTVTVDPNPDFTLGLATVCPGTNPEVTIGGLTGGTAASATMKVNTGGFVPYVASPPNLTISNGITPNATNTITVRNEYGCETAKNIAVPALVPLVCPPVTITKQPAGSD